MKVVTFLVFILAFWIFLPIPLMFFNVGGFNVLEFNNPSKSVNFWDYIGVYFDLLIFNIPGANIFIVYFIRMLQFLTVLFIILLIRGSVN